MYLFESSLSLPLSQNTRLGSAYGFRISSLPRLSTTLANVKKTTLNINFLHFLVTVSELSIHCMVHMYIFTCLLYCIHQTVPHWLCTLSALHSIIMVCVYCMYDCVCRDDTDGLILGTTYKFSPSVLLYIYIHLYTQNSSSLLVYIEYTTQYGVYI